MNPDQKTHLAHIAGVKPIPMPQQPQTIEHTVTTLLGVGIGIGSTETPQGRSQTIVITKHPTGDQLHIPMDPIFAAQLRRDWDHALERARAGQLPTTEGTP